MIKVLIVDDSPTIRHLLKAILAYDPEIKVVGEAKDGIEAIDKCSVLNPHVILTDIRMPRMDGFELIKTIMSEMPRPILVLTSTISDMELGISYKALEAGAIMVMGKPHGLPEEDEEADELTFLIKTVANIKVFKRKFKKDHERDQKIISLPEVKSFDTEIIAIGASTGGPQALYEIFSELPSDFPLPIVVVQHITRGFVDGFVKWLKNGAALKIKKAQHGESLLPGTVYIAPDGHHLLIDSGHIKFSSQGEVDGHKPSITIFFESVAKTYGSKAIGILLTGMGSDGAKGLKAIKDAGGYTIAQDKDTSIVFGMPKTAISIGAVSEVLPLHRISGRLIELISKPHNNTNRRN